VERPHPRLVSDRRLGIFSLQIIHTLQARLSGTSISHEHLEPFRVIYTIESGTPIPAIVTLWHQNRDILHYIRHNPGTDKLALIYQVLCAMSYLHSEGIVHGNIYPGNILITAQGTVRVADVGLNTLIIQSMYDGFLPVSATWMYKAPEELLDGMVTMQTDTYATASTIYTIYALQPPYQPTSLGDARGIREITTRGHRQVFEHSQPAGMSDSIWETVRRCWEFDAQQRPLMKDNEVDVQRLLSWAH